MIIRRICNQHNLEYRPLVSKELSEYVFELFYDYVLKPKKILTGIAVEYSITLSFRNGVYTKKDFPGIISDNTLEIELYKLPNSFITIPKDFTYLVKNERNAFINIIDPRIRFDISNDDYSYLCCAMIHKFLRRKYKKVTDYDFHLVVNQINSTLLKNIPNPCVFSQQDYVHDSGIEYDYFKRFKK